MVRRACIAVALLAGSACAPELEPPRVDEPEVVELVDRLLDAGFAELGIELLDAYALGAEGDAARYYADALILLQRFEDAHARLERVSGYAGHATQIADTCAMGALAAWAERDDTLARARLEPCAEGGRIDLVVLRFRARMDGGEVPAPGELNALLRNVTGADEGPERDLAAGELESLLLRMAARHGDPVEAIEYRRRAFEVGRDPALGATLVDEILETAAAVVEERPQDAATLYERLYLGQTPGLAVPEAARQHARQAAEDALFPVYYSNYEPRYLRKFAEDDEFAGVFERETLSFRFTPPRDASAREAIARWIYARAERPVPTPMADLTHRLGCVAADAPCTFTMRQLAEVSYRFAAYEQAWAEEQGVTLNFP